MNDCIVCIFLPKFDVFKLVLPIKGSCVKAKFSMHNGLLHLNIIITCLGLLNVIFYYTFFGNVCNTTNFLCIVFLVEQVQIIDTLFLMSLFLYYLKLICWELNTCIDLYHKLTKLNPKNKLNFWEYNKVKRISSLGLAIIYMECILLAVLVYGFTSDFLPWYYFRKLITIISSVTQSYGVFIINRRLTVFSVVLNTLKRSLSLNSKAKKLPMLHSKNYFHIFLKTYTALKAMSLYSVYGFTAWILVSIVYLIFNIYVAIRLFDYDVYVVRVLQLRVAITVFELCIICLYVDKIKNLVSSC